MALDMDSNHGITGVSGDLWVVDSNHRVTALHGTSITRWNLNVPSDNNLKPGIYPASGMPFIYTDAQGVLWVDDSSIASNTKPVNISGKARFSPNTVATGYPLISDNQGKVWYFTFNALSTKLHPVVSGGVQLTVKPNQLIQRSFTGPDGKILDFYGGRLRDTGLTANPDQYGERPLTDANEGILFGFAYTDAEGVLHSSNGSATPVKGLAPGLLLPSSKGFNVVDGNGDLWDYTSASGWVRDKKAPKLTPGMWSAGRDVLVFIDDQNQIWTRRSGGWNRIKTTVQFPSNKLESYSYTTVEGDSADGIFAVSQDGGVFHLAADGTGSPVLQSLPITFNTTSNAGSCIAQMPTTGAPEGLSTAGIIAVGMVLAGVMLRLARRRN